MNNNNENNIEKNDPLESLNPEQNRAVLYLDSPLLIIAGAGSGKTKVITQKIAYLIREKGYSPNNILGVTFTNKAANEMKSRIQNLTGIDARFFNISTFHSLGLRILRESGSAVGFDRDWQVIDDADQKKILDKLIKENLNYFTNDMREDLKRKINFAKMDLIYPNNKDYLFQKGFSDDEIRIFTLYFNFQKENKVWDYEDLVSLPVKIFQTHEETRLKYAEKFRYVVVDEFQDTNPNQYELLQAIAGDHKNITIVGDDDQAIYSWRGASIRFLFNFEDDFPGVHIIKLERNYRSTPQVLDFANSLISKNTLRRSKAMWTEKRTGNPVYRLETRSKEDEAEKAAGIILQLQQEEKFRELFPLAILYRINSQSLAFETEFARRGINFKILKGLRFFERKEIKDSLALLKLALNPSDDISFLRVIDFLSVGIGAKTLETLSAHAREKKLPLLPALKECLPEKYKDKKIFPALHNIYAQIGKKNQEQAQEQEQEQEKLLFSEILTRLLKISGYLEFLEEKGEEGRRLNIDELIEFIQKWETENPGESIGDLMDRITLDADANSKENESNKNTCPVYLLTMHNAKGLEFPTVITAGINATYLPFFMRKDKSEIEEERRLFYVAATRAIKQLIVSVGGDKPSPFLSDVSRALYSTVYSYDDIFESQNSPTEHAIPQKAVEEKYLEHPIFGRGKIIAAVAKDKYIVHFDKKGEKTIDASVVPVTFL